MKPLDRLRALFADWEMAKNECLYASARGDESEASAFHERALIYKELVAEELRRQAEAKNAAVSP